MPLHQFDVALRNSAHVLLCARYIAMIGAFVAFVNSSATIQAAEAPAPEKLQLLTDFFENEIATGRLPGAVILIQQHGRPVYLKAFGVRDVGTKHLMTPDTIFSLRSLTKPITSFAAMILVDDGKLSLDDPVSKFVPSFGT
jgi:CubicO group peptidase (beta-lactamase class C family)